MLKAQWISLASNYIKDETLTISLYQEIELHYSEKHRFYHTLNHIKSMLDAVDLFKNNLQDYHVVLFAVWFHDIIYLPLKTNNEEKSALVARKFLSRIGFENERTTKVEQLILKTKNHLLYSDNEDFDTCVFLDSDLLILGSDKSLYNMYMEQIRREYRLVPDFIYNAKRKQFLQKLLDSESIYRTKEFRDSLEKKARENLKFEIEKL